MARNPSTGAASPIDCFFPPSPCSINSWATVHPWDFRHTYKMEPTTEPLQKLPWDELLKGNKVTCRFMPKRSQGVGLIGKVVVAYKCANRSNHRLILLYNQPISIKMVPVGSILVSTPLFSFLIRLQSIRLDLCELRDIKLIATMLTTFH